MWDSSVGVMFFIFLSVPCKGMTVVIMSLCGTFHTIYIAMNCLFAACSGEQRWKHSCGCQKYLQISLYLSHFYVCVNACLCVCFQELWQTKLDSVGGVNSITLFFVSTFQNLIQPKF